jgi:hypothetical protein
VLGLEEACSGTVREGCTAQTPAKFKGGERASYAHSLEACGYLEAEPLGREKSKQKGPETGLMPTFKDGKEVM